MNEKNSFKRLLPLGLAKIRCQWYLMTNGLWRGESEIACYHRDDGRLSYLATVKGSVFEGKAQIKRVFWDEKDTNNGVNR